MLSPFLLSAVQRRLITTPAEAPNLPSLPPLLPALTWPEDVAPQSLPYPPGAMCVVNLAPWPHLRLATQLLLALPVPGRI